MGKRFTATEKWGDPWFSSLTERNRLFWIYLLDNCDHAGIWRANWPLVEFYFPGFNETDMGAFGDRVNRLNEEKWFIPKFIEFQYGELNPDCRAHASVIQRLKKERVYIPYPIPIQRDKDKDKDKDKESLKEDGNSFATFWKYYPKKVSRSLAEKHWDALSPDDEFFNKLMKALMWQRKSSRWTKDDGQYIPNPSTWLEQRRFDDEPDRNGNGGPSPFFDKVMAMQRRRKAAEGDTVGGLPDLSNGMDKTQKL